MSSSSLCGRVATTGTVDCPLPAISALGLFNPPEYCNALSDVSVLVGQSGAFSSTACSTSPHPQSGMPHVSHGSSPGECMSSPCASPPPSPAFFNIMPSLSASSSVAVIVKLLPPSVESLMLMLIDSAIICSNSKFIES